MGLSFRFLPALLLPALLALAGCSKKPPGLVHVTGSVKFSDGTVPVGEVHTIRFEPVLSTDGLISTRPATATVQPDGSFKLMTFKPGDGAQEGDYKVALLFWRSYRPPHNSLVPDIYEKSQTTPLPIMKVRAGEKNHFDLTVEKR